MNMFAICGIRSFWQGLLWFSYLLCCMSFQRFLFHPIQCSGGEVVACVLCVWNFLHLWRCENESPIAFVTKQVVLKGTKFLIQGKGVSSRNRDVVQEGICRCRMLHDPRPDRLDLWSLWFVLLVCRWSKWRDLAGHVFCWGFLCGTLLRPIGPSGKMVEEDDAGVEPSWYASVAGCSGTRWMNALLPRTLTTCTLYPLILTRAGAKCDTLWLEYTYHVMFMYAPSSQNGNKMMKCFKNQRNNCLFRFFCYFLIKWRNKIFILSERTWVVNCGRSIREAWRFKS